MRWEKKDSRGGNMVSESSFMYKVRLKSLSDVMEFVRIASSLPYEITLVNGKHRLNAKSYLGVILAKTSWDEMYIESAVESYFDFEKFIA